MTALAVALVLCCAMVCGTALALRRFSMRDERKTLVERRLDALTAAGAQQAGDITRLSSEVESLRAQVALRSL
jgi:hypothetical protein